MYVPRDERFSHQKTSDALAYALKFIAQFAKPGLGALVDSTRNEFDSLDDILKLYEGGIELPDGPILDNFRKNIPLQMLKEIFRTDGEQLFKFPMPQVIKGMNYYVQLQILQYHLFGIKISSSSLFWAIY